MYHGSHQAQDAARPLKLFNARPIIVEAAQEFGMDGVRCLDASVVIGLACVGGKLLRLTAVEVHKGAGYRITGDKQVGLGNGLEESPGYDLKAFLGVGRTP